MEWNETLIKMARPDIYRINAFRILNIPVTASQKEIKSHIRKHDLMEKFENIKNQDSDVFPVSIMRDHNARNEAHQRLLDPELRFIDEFFWFWPQSLNANEDNDEAFQAIRKNDLLEASSIWKDREIQGSEANVSMHNLAILYHAIALDFECIETRREKISNKQIEQKRDCWEKAFTRWKMLLSDEGFWHRVQSRIRDLDDPRLTANTAHRIREGLPKALLSINAILAVEASEMNDFADMTFHLTIMQQSGFDSSIIEQAIYRALAPIRNNLKAMCLHTEEEIRDAPGHGNKVATSLINDTSPLLNSLDRILPKGDATRETARDAVALQVRSCFISYINEKNDWHNTLELSEKALKIASSKLVKQKIRDDVETIKSNLEYSTCWFCGKASAKSGAVVTVMMYGNVERNWGLLGTKVNYQNLPVPVPRCRSCETVHLRGTRWGCAAPIVALVIGALFGYAAESFLVGLGIFAGCWLFIYIISQSLRPQGIKAESYKKEFRMVQKMQSQGWKIGDSP